MADSLICTSEIKKSVDGFPASASSSSSASSLFQRRIEFHPARKPFSVLSNGVGDFHLETLNPSSDSRSAAANAVSSASTGKKSEGGDSIDHVLDPELSFGITFRRIGAGLENLGNTCFLNSVLQCLTYTEPFAAYLQSGKHQSSCHTAGFCAMCALQKHVSRALQSTGRILAPKDLVSNLRCISRNFRNARQEDAHEYMVNLLESMHKCCLPSGVPSESPGAFEKSLVHKIFGGRLRSQVKCMQCSYCSNTFDPFLDLSLEIVKADSVCKALAHFTALEQLDGGERQYQCQRCKQKVKALKQLTIHKAPYVLTIHLKRFGSHVPGQKIDKKVEFGPTLDLKPFVSGSYERDLKYTLYGVLVHAGWSTRSGHYYCFVRTSSGMWYSLDDNRVFQVGERTVLEQKAYMLFYVRDRKNIVPKKPLNAVSRDNVVSNSMEIKNHSLSAQADQNVLVGRTLNSAYDSATAIQMDTLSGRTSKELLPNQCAVVKTNGVVLAEESLLKKDHILETSKREPLLISSVNGKGNSPLHSSMSKIVCNRFPQSAPSLGQCNGTISHLDDVIVAKNSPVNERKVSRNDISVPIATTHNCNGSESPGFSEIATQKAFHKIGVVNENESNESPSNSLGDLKSEEVDPGRLPNQLGVNDGQNHGKSNERVESEPRCEKLGDTNPRLTGMHRVEIPCQSDTSSGHVQKRALCQQNNQKLLKPKKKLAKCQVSRMNFGSSLVYRVAVTLRKKKKHKRNKRHSLELRASMQEDLLREDCTATDLGPSTSDKSRTIALDKNQSRRLGAKSHQSKGTGHMIPKDGRDSSDNSLLNIPVGDFRKRISEESTVLATDLPTEKSLSSISAADHRDIREPVDLKDSTGNSMQNDLMSMLTRGLDDIRVARWDGIELPSSDRLGFGSQRTHSIGYVPDEWDEEYDRGKRKKVRDSKESFGGPNLFQEVATLKSKMKKAKLDRTSSGNRPFRI